VISFGGFKLHPKYCRGVSTGMLLVQHKLKTICTMHGNDGAYIILILGVITQDFSSTSPTLRVVPNRHVQLNCRITFRSSTDNQWLPMHQPCSPLIPCCGTTTAASPITQSPPLIPSLSHYHHCSIDESNNITTRSQPSKLK
jgi:hypothetical protein